MRFPFSKHALNDRVQRFTSGGSFINSSDPQGYGIREFIAPKGIACNKFGEIFVVTGDDKVVIARVLRGFSLRGASGGSGTSLGQFRDAVNVCVSDRGTCVADTGNNRLQFFEPPQGSHADLTVLTPRFPISQELGLKRPSAITWVTDLIEEKVYIADTGNDRVILVQLPTETPVAVWNAMKQHLLKGDMAAALALFSKSSQSKYYKAYLSMGPKNLNDVFSQLPPIEPVFIQGDRAQYRFEQLVQGFKTTFPIDFVKENGQWKIERY